MEYLLICPEDCITMQEAKSWVILFGARGRLADSRDE